jgi:hypothetical protein
MTNKERQQLDTKYWELERQIQNIHDGMVVDGDPATVEAELLEQQDAIEFELGQDYFKQQ